MWRSQASLPPTVKYSRKAGQRLTWIKPVERDLEKVKGKVAVINGEELTNNWE